MKILKTIDSEAKKSQKRFIVIGGHALNVHGISRTTGDLDLMVERQALSFWKGLLVGLKYNIFQETSAFLQSKSAEIAAWPIDLMLVSEDTMNKALSDARMAKEFGVEVPVASVASLIAMKIHALKSNDEQRMQKDLGDLFALLQLAGLSPSDETFRQLCLKYGTIELYERLQKPKNP